MVFIVLASAPAMAQGRHLVVSAAAGGYVSVGDLAGHVGLRPPSLKPVAGRPHQGVTSPRVDNVVVNRGTAWFIPNMYLGTYRRRGGTGDSTVLTLRASIQSLTGQQVKSAVELEVGESGVTLTLGAVLANGLYVVLFNDSQGLHHAVTVLQQDG
ncbi:MAG: hypothetical protein J5I53_05800 [Bradyrhizobiaceae bacterium]|nr:hypothetical protein [Bradyrhizobiaceae bacterium]